MQAFVALFWDQEDGPASDAASELLLCSGQRARHRVPLMRREGFVLMDLSHGSCGSEFLGFGVAGPFSGGIIGPVFGEPFTASSEGPLKEITRDAAQRIFNSCGASLISDYWGSYIGFLKIPGAGYVITDPTSAIPCFYSTWKGVTLVFSHLEKLPFLDRIRLTINEDFVGRLLVSDKIQTGETGLSEVAELEGGRRLRIVSGGLTVDRLWDASVIAGHRKNLSPETAAYELRETARAVIRARALQFRRITVSLSGGLDSAIVLGCLRSVAGTKVNAIHQYSNAGDPPEVHYAREVAAAAGCSLAPVEIPAERQLPDIRSHPLSARPHRSFISPDFTGLLSGNPGFLGDAIFTGEGGDHLLQHSGTALVFADHLRDHGISGETLHQLIAAARLSGLSAWRVAVLAMPHQFRSAEPDDRSSGDLPPAKAAQVARLSHMLHVREALDHTYERRLVHPLISQPFMELCLRLPTYQLCLDGVSRGLARMAFRDIIPDSVRTRMSKGNATRYAVALIRANRERVGEALRSGQLVRRGLIDPARVEEFLSEDRFRFLELGRRMLVYYCIEGWLSRWTEYLASRPNRP